MRPAGLQCVAFAVLIDEFAAAGSLRERRRCSQETKTVCATFRPGLGHLALLSAHDLKTGQARGHLR